MLAKVTLHGHSYTYGLLSAVFGAGALLGALAAASLGRASIKVLLVGAAICVEIWNPNAWMDLLRQEMPDFGTLLKELSN